MDRKIKVLVLDNQIISPPESGGPLRIYNLFSNLPENFEVTYLGVTGWQYLPRHKKKIKENYHEQIVPLSKPFIIVNNFLHNILKSIPTFDISCAMLMFLTPQFLSAYINEAKDADIIITSHPWFTYFLNRYRSKLKVYDSHNCEYLLYKEFFRDNYLNRVFLGLIKKIEGNACRKSDLVITCSGEDRDKLMEIYGVPKERIEVIPNPIDASSLSVASEKEKESLKERYGLAKRKVAIFLGTYFLPNIHAFNYIMDELAPGMKDWTFLIVGTVSRAYGEQLDADVSKYRTDEIAKESGGIMGLGWFELEKWGHEGFDVRWTKKDFSFYILDNDATRITLNIRSLKKIPAKVFINDIPAGSITFKTGIEFRKMQVGIPEELRGQGLKVVIRLSRLSKSLFFDTRDVGIAVRGISYETHEGKKVAIPLDETIVPCTLPENIRLMGRVDAGKLRELLQCSDVAINPVSHGSGLNIKMLDYMAAGLPIVTTKIGMRGIPAVKCDGIEVCELDDFSRGMRAAARTASAPGLRDIVIGRYDAKKVSKDMSSVLEKYAAKKG